MFTKKILYLPLYLETWKNLEFDNLVKKNLEIEKLKKKNLEIPET